MELREKQAAILSSAARMVKIGGRLVYATCSLLQEENEDVVTQFLAAHPEYELVPMKEVQVASPDGKVKFILGPNPERLTWSATMDELPWAMLANGPAWTKAGVPSRVCIRFGLIASFISAANAPASSLSFAAGQRPRRQTASPL